ncbi:MAG TPA: ABC transporter permease [Chryseolinea sp.]
MFKNYLVIAYRNLLRHKVFSFITVTGLSVGITASLLLLQYVAYERSYDEFHHNGRNIYRIRHDTYKKGILENRSAISYYGAAPAIQQSFPQVSAFVRLHRADGMYSFYNAAGETISHYETNAFYADSTFFDIFSFPLISGDKKKILRAPNSLMISATAAKKYFGNTDPVGKTISLVTEWEGGDYTVEGIFKDIPENSHLQFDFIFSIQTLLVNNQFKHGAWYWTNFYTYLLLIPGADPAALEQKLASVIDTHLGNHLQKTNSAEILHLQPLHDIHLYSNLSGEISVNGDHTLVSFLLFISFLIVGIAWLNYINLSTAKAMERGREVGMRKIMGSTKVQLIQQFLFESSILTLISVVIGSALFVITLPYFNDFTGKESLYAIGQSGLLPMASGVIILGSFLSGLYPAFILSSYHPLETIKGKFIRNIGSALFRKAMIVFQFGAAILLIIATLTVAKQLEFMRGHDLGLNIDHKVILRGPRLIKDKSYLNTMDNFKNALKDYSGVTSVSASSEVPGREIFWTNEFRMAKESENVRRVTSILAVDEDFISTYDITIIAGRNFMKDHVTDFGGAVIINESALYLLGFKDPETVIDQELILADQSKKVIGVIKDFHQVSLKQAKQPTILQYIPWSQDYLTVSLNTPDLKGMMANLDKVYHELFPENAFEYFFLDDLFNQQYESEERAWKLFILFSGLAIMIGCMGLFGLSSFTTLQRTKEVAIRKVLGASVVNITMLLSKDFMRLIGIAFALAIPVAWYLIHQWLLTFAHRIMVPWGAFILGGTLTAAIAVLTVSFQTVKAATQDPVKSIKMD